MIFPRRIISDFNTTLHTIFSYFDYSAAAAAVVKKLGGLLATLPPQQKIFLASQK